MLSQNWKDRPDHKNKSFQKEVWDRLPLTDEERAEIITKHHHEKKFDSSLKSIKKKVEEK